jgi:hypothetical protein
MPDDPQPNLEAVAHEIYQRRSLVLHNLTSSLACAADGARKGIPSSRQELPASAPVATDRRSDD